MGEVQVKDRLAIVGIASTLQIVSWAGGSTITQLAVQVTVETILEGGEVEGDDVATAIIAEQLRQVVGGVGSDDRCLEGPTGVEIQRSPSVERSTGGLDGEADQIEGLLQGGQILIGGHDQVMDVEVEGIRSTAGTVVDSDLVGDLLANVGGVVIQVTGVTVESVRLGTTTHDNLVDEQVGLNNLEIERISRLGHGVEGQRATGIPVEKASGVLAVGGVGDQ